MWTPPPGTPFWGEAAAEDVLKALTEGNEDLKAAGVTVDSFLTCNYVAVAPAHLGRLPFLVKTMLVAEPRLRLCFTRKNSLQVWWGPDEEAAYGELSIPALERAWVAQNTAWLQSSPGPKFRSSLVPSAALSAANYTTPEGRAFCADVLRDKALWFGGEVDEGGSGPMEHRLLLNPEKRKAAVLACARHVGGSWGWLETYLMS